MPLLSFFFHWRRFSPHIFCVFIFGCPGPSLLRGSLLWRAGAALQVCSAGVSLRRLFVAEHGLQGIWVSVVVARGLHSCSCLALEHRLSSYGPQAQLFRGMWDLPRSGIEPMSLALAGRFFPTEPPGKPLFYPFKK